MVHDSINMNELWHKRLNNFHYISLPILGKMVAGLPQLHVENDGISKGCAIGMNTKGLSSDNRSKGIFEFVHSDLCGPMIVSSLSGSSLMDETVAVTMTGCLQ
jgi:hypothetical protein